MSKDTIYRQAAIDAALTFLVEYCGAAFDEDMQKMLCERLNALPSAQPEQRWIPCTPDTMPEDSNFYIVTRKDFSVGARWYSVFYGWERQEEEQPIAWIPLPEPYKEVQE